MFKMSVWDDGMLSTNPVKPQFSEWLKVCRNELKQNVSRFNCLFPFLGVVLVQNGPAELKAEAL